LKWAWPAIAFLILMVPLPFRVETAMALPMQELATRVSTFGLQTIGVFARSRGTVIFLQEGKIHVADACGGLSMLVAFIAVSAFVAIAVKRVVWQRIVILLFSVPIALLLNAVRIIAAGVVYAILGQEWSNFFHDASGWLMMPAAAGLLWVQLRVFDAIYIPPPDGDPVPLEFVYDDALSPTTDY
jgi:exosortase